MTIFSAADPRSSPTDDKVAFCGCCLGRRRFMAAGLAAAALSTRNAFGQAPAVKAAPARRIDVHHHFLPPQYMKEEHERINFGHGAVSTS